MDTTKDSKKPTSNCQYGKQCYRRNPQHLLEYRHEHLDKIIESNTTANCVEQYNVPDEFLSHKDLILEQIKIVIENFPRQIDIEPAAKRVKSDEAAPIQSKTLNSPAGAASVDVFAQSKNNTNNVASTSATSTPKQTAPTPKINIHDYVKVVNPKGKMAQKLADARPYNYFLTCITSSPRTHTEPLSITFQEILDPSLGNLECSVQINFMVEAGWLLGQYTNFYYYVFE